MGFKNFAAAALCLCLAACGAPKTRQPPAKGEELPRPPAGAAAYSIDPAQSELRVLVYRAGPMARLGHNHVILNRAVGGWVDAAARPESASFSLYVPVADFVIDDARARSEEGPDFSAEVPEEAKSGTRRNMLGEALLDAGRFPVITLTSVGIRQAPDGGIAATLTIGVAGRESTVVVPFVLEASVGRISAAGSVVLRQSELGLTPLSVMLGALQVQDDITVRFRFVAMAANT
ncbi:MAG TPA: YceI family protein [Steroidobacteraceae bacterium]|nr:YceI family protein [Steroidobacteraceae bacterium]